MKTKRYVLAALSLSIVLVMAVFLANQKTADAQKCRIVRIHQEKGSAGTVIRVEPETVHISKDTCVIWINWVKAQEVSVVFREDGKNCQDATEAPMGFKMAENCYVSNFIPLGGTSSLKFNDQGTYRYDIEVPGEQKATGSLALGRGDIKGKGEIVVGE